MVSIAIQLNKQLNETEKQYIWRIGMAKENGLIDLHWNQIAEIINKELYGDDTMQYLSSSAYRKPFQSAKLYFDEVFSKTEFNTTEELILQKIELEELKKQIQTEKLEYNRWIRENARDNLFIEKIIEAVKETGQHTSIQNDIDTTSKNNISNDDVSHILMFGDCHFGSDFEIKGLKGEIINKYNPEIFYSRMNKVLEEAVRFIHVNNAKHLYIFDLGDAIDGILRVSQLFTLRYGVVESSVKYATYIADWLYELSKHTSVSFRMVNGNHSELRMLGQPKGTFANDNMGYVIYEIIKTKLENIKNIDMANNEVGMIFEEIQGYNILGYHGEHKNLEKAIKDFANIYDVNIDILVAGHLHHTFNESVGFAKDIIRTPSIIGVDNFSMKIGKASDAGATIISIKKDYGKINDYHIKLK